MGWEVVGYSSDPISDDPNVVDAQVKHLQRVASAIAAQLEKLPTDGKVDGLDWDSDAAKGFREVVKKLPKDLGTLKTRYEGVAKALERFSATLRGCKGDAAQGLAEAQRAHDNASSFAYGVRAMEDHQAAAEAAAQRANAAAPPGATMIAPEPWSGTDYRAELTKANAAFAKAKAKVDDAVKRFAVACRTAAKDVDHANHDGLKNSTGFWHSIGKGIHWATKNLHLEALSGLLSKISLVAGVLAAILAFVPGAQGVAGALEVVSLATAGAALVLDLVLQADKAYQGTFSLGNFVTTIGVDALAVAAGWSGLKAGRAAEAARTAATEAKVATRVAAKASTTAEHAVTVRKLAVSATTGGPLRRGAAAVAGHMLGTGNLGRLATTSLAKSELALGEAARTERVAREVQGARQAEKAAAVRFGHQRDAASVAVSSAGVANVVDNERHDAKLEQAARRGAALTPAPFP